MRQPYEFEKKFGDQIYRCSSCGFCRAVCPVFGLTSRPALNARGKMLILQEVLEGRAELSEELVDTLFQCTTCANCSVHCPSGVEVPEIIKAVRKDMVGSGTCHPAFAGMKEILDRHTNIYGEDEPEDFGRERNRRAEYVYFIGCVGQYREDEATEETLRLLDRLEVDYTLIDEVCCSGVLEDVGFQMNQDLVDRNVRTVLATGAKTVITGCPYCYRTFNNKPRYAALKEAGVRVIHISQFLKDFDWDVRTDKVVTYHDPCDLGRHTGIYEEPRETIRKIAPNFVELPNARAEAVCCGAGGGVRAAFAANSIAMARKRLEEVESVGADVLLTDCNSCLHNLANAKLRRQKFKVFTIAQFLNRLLDEARVRPGAKEVA
ncbi:MAG: (Fe-S)-binding protein [Deltaproteobacteria bacterium]|nr:(Fe-S)-binding protein [Deltaproteobacteria bacterium]